jgi:hypothetical protein
MGAQGLLDVEGSTKLQVARSNYRLLPVSFTPHHDSIRAVMTACGRQTLRFPTTCDHKTVERFRSCKRF